MVILLKIQRCYGMINFSEYNGEMTFGDFYISILRNIALGHCQLWVSSVADSLKVPNCKNMSPKSYC